MKAEEQLAAKTAEARRRAARSADRAAPLLPAATRRPAAIVACCCLVVVTALAVLFAHQTRPPGIDRAIYSWIVGLHVPTAALVAVSRLGGVTATTVLMATLALGCLAARRVRAAVLTVASMVLAAALTEWVLKPAVDRTITSHHYITYPSGHTTGVFALTAALAVVLLSARSRARWRPFAVATVVLAVLVSCAVGAAMIALDFHYFTDTVAGAAVGTGVVIAVAFLLDLNVSGRWLGRFGR